MQKTYMIIAVLFALLANILGAFATHALKNVIEPVYLEVFQTGVQYQFYHSLALLSVAILMFHLQSKWLVFSGWGFILGCLFFSGSLYFLALTGCKFLGAITPIGGLAFLCGWSFLLFAVLTEQ